MSEQLHIHLSDGTKSAIISDCKKYRYSLSRVWDSSKPKVLFIMLNPSTADANNDDPTIRRCMNFAKSWGFGSLYVGNLFAFRSKEPTHLLYAEDPIGNLNANHLQTMSEFVDLIVCAWGNAETVYKITDKF